MDPFGKSNFIFQPLIFRGYLSFWGSSQPGNLPKVGVQNCKRSNPRPLTWKYSQNCSGMNHHAVFCMFQPGNSTHSYTFQCHIWSLQTSTFFSGWCFLVSFCPDISFMQPLRSNLTSKSRKKTCTISSQGPQFVLFAHPSCWRSKSFIAIGLLMSDQLRIPTGLFWGDLRSSCRVV